MNIMPTGNIKLIESPFDNYTDSSKLKWITQVAQTQYFNNTVHGMVLSNADYTIIDNGVIRVNEEYGTITEYDYLIFNSTDYYNKNFYCFIKNVKRVTPNTCDVYFNVDGCQTWYFDGSKNKYLSKTPIGTFISIKPQISTIPAGSTVQFSCCFTDTKHISQLGSFLLGHGDQGISLTHNGKLTVASTVASGTLITVLVRDKTSDMSATVNVTIS